MPYIRKIFAPIILAILYLIIALSGNSAGIELTLISIIATVISVLLARYIWPSSIYTVAFSITVVSIIFPIFILYSIGNSSHISTSLSEVLKHIPWHTAFFPVLFAIVITLFLNRTKKKPAKIDGK